MAVRTVNASLANVSDGSFAFQLAGIVNDLATAMNALTAKLDADAGVTDANYASTIGTIDTLTTKENGTPT